MDQPSQAFCSRFHQAIELIGRRWAGAILRALMSGRARYADLRNAIPEISDRMLSERLKELEGEGIVARFVSTEAPVRVEYELTEKGRALDQAFQAVAEWAEAWVPPLEPPQGKSA